MIQRRVHNFGTYFVTTQTWGRRSLFQVDDHAKLFVRTLYKYRAQRKYLLHDFVVMRDHVHLIITPLEITVERAMQFIKGGFSYAMRQNGRETKVWQKGFTDHRIRDAADYEQHRAYIHANPVSRGLCEVTEQYLFSSAYSGYGLDDVPQRLKPLASAVERHG